MRMVSNQPKRMTIYHVQAKLTSFFGVNLYQFKYRYNN